MKAYGKLHAGTMQSTLSNDRGHTVVCDLTKEQGGEDSAASALELSVMSLAGCVTTLWAIVAQNSRVSFNAFEVEIEAEKDSPTGTVSRAILKATVSSDEDQAKLKRCFEKTLKMCPVGQLWEKAGVDISEELVIAAGT